MQLIYTCFGVRTLANPAYRNVLATLKDTGNAIWKEMVEDLLQLATK